MKTSEPTPETDAPKRKHPHRKVRKDGSHCMRMWTCQHCARTFTAKAVHDRRGTAMARKFCSRRCFSADRSAQALAACAEAQRGMSPDDRAAREKQAKKHRS